MNSGRPRYDHELLGSSFAHNAELSEPSPPGPRNIVTPCHGAELDVAWDGATIYCSAANCTNEWSLEGIVEYWREPQ